MITQFGSSKFGQNSFGGGNAKVASAVVGLIIACLGDPSSHGGTISVSGQDGKAKVNEIEIGVEGAIHSCPIIGHGVTSITAVTTKSFINGKKILTYGAQAGCGAIITPRNRKVTVEA